MNINFMKKYFTRFPYSVGNFVAKIPYSNRPFIGEGYRDSQSIISTYDNYSVSERQSWIFNNIYRIANFAYDNIPFYKDYYYSHGFNPSALSCFDDIKDIPIITKSVLQDVDIEKRSTKIKGRALVNTGGSSGSPLSFYISPGQIPHEWAHIHRAWSHVGFRSSNLKIMFSGRSTVSNLVDYDSARHSLVVDIYKPKEAVANKLLHYTKYNPLYLHGYPSAIFDFLLWVHEHKHPLYNYLKDNIKGIVFSSEFPAEPQRKKVYSIYNIKSLSFYGHSERAVLATEEGCEYKFVPLQTYGFSESVNLENKNYLVGTTYYNFASPLIRYNTDDVIKPIITNQMLDSFQILEGRKGDFIIDCLGNKITLTALIFGRHHKLFNFVSSIQVHQAKAGFATILLVMINRNNYQSFVASDFFDSSNVNIKFDFNIIEEPIRTGAGKLPLLVRDYKK
jgi:phenylacetate-CoA ligase